MTTNGTPSAPEAAPSRTVPIDDNPRGALALLRHAYACASGAGAEQWDFASAASSQLSPPTESASPRGGQTALRQNETPATHSGNGSTAAACKPCWNSTRRELCLGDMVVKRFRVPAQVQQLILSAFEEECWPEHILDPLPGSSDIDPHTRLHDAIRRFNGHQTQCLLRLRVRATGPASPGSFASRPSHGKPTAWEPRSPDNDRHQIDACVPRGIG